MKVPEPRKLKSGNWFVQLRLGGESIPITSRDRDECRRQARYVKAQYLAGKRAPEPKTGPEKLPTLREAIDNYISARDNILSPATIRGYRTIKRNRFQEQMDKSLADTEDEEWARSCNEMAKQLAPKTVVNTWGLVGSVIRDATGHEPPKVKMPLVPPSDTPFLEPEEVLQFIGAVKGDKYEIPALLALSSLRRSEICGLLWEHVDLEHGIINVKGAVVPGEDHKFVRKKTNKNRSSTRPVPILIPELEEALKRERQTSGPVVTCSPNTLRNAINRVCTAEGLPEVGVHGLRHSFASLAYYLDVPEKNVMEIGGWQDDKTMKKIYTHIARKSRERYTEKFADFFASRGRGAEKQVER